MDDILPIEALSAQEIRYALEEAGYERRWDVDDFVERIGGPENARLAVEMLSRLENAA